MDDSAFLHINDVFLGYNVIEGDREEILWLPTKRK